MGFAVSWLAVSDKEPSPVLEALGFSRTETTEEFPESDFTCAALPGSWFLVCAHEFDSLLSAENVLGPLSAGCKVIACQVEEHVMVSAVTAYADGARVWRVEHDTQQDTYHLSVKGLPPAQLDEIHANLKRQQDEEGGSGAEVDYLFDVPVVLAESITGYRHDKDFAELSAERFVVLRQDHVVHKPRPWWKIW